MLYRKKYKPCTVIFKTEDKESRFEKSRFEKSHLKVHHSKCDSGCLQSKQIALKLKFEKL